MVKGAKLVKHTGKLDLACGNAKVEGFFGIDKHKTESTDATFDLLQFPWPIESDSVEEARCCMFFEHIPKEKRKGFMEELHRVLKKAKGCQIIVPMGDRMFQDPTHEWPPVIPGSFLYYNQDWLTQNKLQHGDYITSADFDYSYGYALAPSVAARNAEYQQFAVNHFHNAATDLHVTVVKK